MSSLNSRDYGRSTPQEHLILGVILGVAAIVWAAFGLWWVGYWWAGHDTTDLGPRILDGSAPWIRESTVFAVILVVTAMVLALLLGLLTRKFRGTRMKEDAAASHMGRPEEVRHMTLKERKKQVKALDRRFNR